MATMIHAVAIFIGEIKKELPALVLSDKLAYLTEGRSHRVEGETWRLGMAITGAWKMQFTLRATTNLKKTSNKQLT